MGERRAVPVGKAVVGVVGHGRDRIWETRPGEASAQGRSTAGVVVAVGKIAKKRVRGVAVRDARELVGVVVAVGKRDAVGKRERRSAVRGVVGKSDGAGPL